MGAKTVVVAGVTVAIVFYAGQQVQLGIDQQGKNLSCLVQRDGREVRCDEQTRTYAMDRYLGRETDEGRIYEARRLAEMPVPPLPRGRGSRAGILAGAWQACKTGAVRGAGVGVALGGLNGALFGSWFFGVGAVPGAFIGAAGGGVLFGAGGCYGHIVDYTIGTTVDGIVR